jgi:two-component sensor histidine kinase/DNA-binding response OmpR family regulator
MTCVLIADDNEDSLYFLEQLLMSTGFKVTTAKNGAEAISVALKNPPDLMISDILMPVLDGFALCRAWKQDPRLAHIPFIFYTATYTDLKDEQFALDLGADKFIIKPQEPTDLLRLIDEVLVQHLNTEKVMETVLQPSDVVYLKEYNEALFRKLDDKIDQIENVNKQLSQKDEFSHAVLNSLPAQIAVVDIRGKVLAVNQSWEKYAQDIEEPLFMRAGIGTSLFDICDTGLAETSLEQQVIKNVKKILYKQLVEFEIESHFSISGKEYWFLFRIMPLQKIQGAVLVYFDITARKLLEDRLKLTLLEKSNLLSELFHRTRNNMQVISSVLEIQSEYTSNSAVKQVLRETLSRIQALSLVFQQIYKTQNLNQIDLKEYLTELTNLLFASYNTPRDKIALVLEIEREFVLFDIAIPCGLVVNELITNALTHAFPHERTGVIRLCLHRVISGEIEVELIDNGVGLPSDSDIDNMPTLGIRLVRTIVTKQLKGCVNFKTDRGFSCRIRFKDTLYSERV